MRTKMRVTHKNTHKKRMTRSRNTERNKRKSYKGGSNGKSRKRLACSLGRKNDYTCYTDESLLKLKTLWNARHPDDIIKTNDAKKIWRELKSRLSGVCESETCWLNQHFVDDKLATKLRNLNFAPEAPASWAKNPHEWLSSIDIEKVMKQYEKAYPCFEFIGPSPMDYDTHLAYGECVWEELCKFDLDNFIKRKKYKIGVIFNTDPHYLPGSHWVSLFVNLKRGYIFYFDSAGDPAPKQVVKLAKNIQKQGDKLGMELEFIQNAPRVHQRGDNECGMYSLYAITSLLKDIRSPQSFLVGGEITDDSMHRMRDKYFNTPGSLR